jgi:hypothetical protein
MTADGPICTSNYIAVGTTVEWGGAREPWQSPDILPILTGGGATSLATPPTKPASEPGLGMSPFVIGGCVVAGAALLWWLTK